jgi:hypothetical protein
MGRYYLVSTSNVFDGWVPEAIRKSSYESALSLATDYFSERFRDSNRRLQEYVNLDLAMYCYQM